VPVPRRDPPLRHDSGSQRQGGVSRERGNVDFYPGKLRAAPYRILTELPRVAQLSELGEAVEDCYAEMSPEWF
jgi:hypothetical protein